MKKKQVKKIILFILLEMDAVEEEKKQQPQPRLVDVQINNESDALNLLVSFISLAQKRGAFTIDESAKIWDCIKKFQKSP